MKVPRSVAFPSAVSMGLKKENKDSLYERVDTFSIQLIFSTCYWKSQFFKHFCLKFHPICSFHPIHGFLPTNALKNWYSIVTQLFMNLVNVASPSPPPPPPPPPLPDLAGSIPAYDFNPFVWGFVVTSFVQVKAIVLLDHQQSPTNYQTSPCSCRLDPIQ
jgi:hypothetical protein